MNGDLKNELKQRLVEDCDIEYICEQAGVEMRHKGNAVECLCPFHADEHFGSAKIHGKGIYCFACGAFYSVFDIVMKQMSMTYYDAYKFIASMTGNINDYMLTKSEKKNIDRNRFPFTKDDLEFLNWSDVKVRIIDSVDIVKPEGDDIRYFREYSEKDDMTYYCLYHTETLRIRDQWESDREGLVEMMGDKCCSKAEEFYRLYEKQLLHGTPETQRIVQICLKKALDLYRKLEKYGYKKKEKKKGPVLIRTVAGTKLAF